MYWVKKFQTDWPFAAGKSPWFYGWAIAGLSTLGFLMSIPGQTMGMAVYSDDFIAAFGLTRTELSTAYLFGTLGSAFLLPRAGRWFDRYGARSVLLFAAMGLSLMLLWISVVRPVGNQLSAWLGLPLAWVTFPLILVGYFGVRFTGQGVLTGASRNVLLLWFVRRRGLVSGVRGVFVSLGFSLAPLVLVTLIEGTDWQASLWWLALVVGLGFGGLVFLLVRDRPEVCGLRADNAPPDTSATGKPVDGVKDLTLSEVRRMPVFWLYSASLAIHALFGTALTFHVAAIFEAAGRSRAEAFGYFIPQAVVSVCVNLSASAMADHMRLKPLLQVMLVAFLLGAYGLLKLETACGYWLLVVGFGAGGGLWGVLSNLVFVRQFGPRHLGEISGFNTSVTVFASAIGPVLFSFANDVSGRFDMAAIACMFVLMALLVMAMGLPQPLDRKPQFR